MMKDKILFATVGALFIGLGVPLALRRVGPNGLYGLRTPATFANKEVWYEANAISGRDCIALGALLLVLVFVLPYLFPHFGRGYTQVYTAVILAGVLWIGIRGWRKANELLRMRPPEDPGGAV
jgi:uncharacterized membrane protein